MKLSTIIRNLLENFPLSDSVPIFYGRRISRQELLSKLDLAWRAERNGDSKLLRTISQEIGYENPWS